MAVRAAHRGTGIGARVLLRLVEIAQARGDAAVELSSQCHAIGFYARHDFVAYGEVHDDCGIPHRMMRRALR
jgi:predicted GNAT family N-acyltransferase